MPCACQLPFENYPEAGVWGPILWDILHGFAERVGSCPFPMYQADERRAIISWMKSVAKMIPCPSCKEHYTVYLSQNPPDKFVQDLPYGNLKAYVRVWFWELHNWVNESKGIPLYQLYDVEGRYRSIPLRERLRQLKEPMEKAIRISGNQLIGYQEFQTNCTKLLSIYGI